MTERFDSRLEDMVLNTPRKLRGNSRKMRVSRMPDSHSIISGDYMDDVQHFTPEQLRQEVVLGVYGSEDWVVADHLRGRHLAGKTTVQYDVTWLVPAGFKLQEFVTTISDRYTFFAANRVHVITSDGGMKLTTGRGKIEVEFVGDPAWAVAQLAKFDTLFKRAASLIEWVYSNRGDEISVPLNYRPAINAAYPWLKKPVTEYIDDYLNSQASVLILIGPPGTGKTTFIKNLVHRSGGNAKVAYDEKVMGDDSLFAGFIDGEARFMIMEDADAFLEARSDGNTMMHKFLNVSDGLISAADKKLVFSTNLPNINDIDSALMRPGRCYDVVEFRSLTREEAEAVVAETGTGTVPDGKTCTLAEIFSTQPSEGTRRKRGIGFHP